ncbi:hypothetical protein HMPREF7215_2040 [Pyramidobacter piscolens W5455]|uniref:Uncharacterized protein n=1 Tax=Pyramidobacter piscolens W5455 TaxID=352165 RepID=A0ABM9ZXL6_9BACT|nr:hypothetical protein HMPREF7215_2040 [Pyramidobacter piscolens W5455]
MAWKPRKGIWLGVHYMISGTIYKSDRNGLVALRAIGEDRSIE